MSDARIVRWVQNSPWAITPEMADTILGVLARRQEGVKLEADELHALIDNGRQPFEAPDGPKNVAILPLFGVMSQRMNMVSESSGGTSVEKFTKEFQAAVDSPDIAAIVLQVDSPGGSIYGVQELADAIFAARGKKPVVAVADSMAASAAYWAASQADEVVVAPGAEVGSIGVLSMHQDLSKMAEMKGVKTTILRAGKFKAEANPYEPLSESAKRYLQGKVDLAYDHFVEAVSRGRRASKAKVRDGFGQGRMVPAEQAIASGMADRQATMAEVLEGLGELLSRQNGATGNGLVASEIPPESAVQPTRHDEENAMTEAEFNAALDARLQGFGETMSKSLAAALPAALKPLEDKLAAQEARLAESEQRAALNNRVEKLDGLVRAGKITPAERASEEKLLAHVPADLADERIGELSRRSARLVSRMTGPVSLSDEGDTEIPAASLKGFLLPQQDARHLDPTKLEIVRQAKAQAGGDPAKFREIAYSLAGEVQ